MANDLFSKWLTPSTQSERVAVWGERPGARAAGLKIVRTLLAEHFVGEATIVQAGGYTKAAAVIANSLPTNKRTRSGDLGELLATEYIDAQTPFLIPIRKLRWKSDRQMPMHGNDVVAVDPAQNPVRVLKGECKSRAAFGPAVVKEAAEGLDKDGGRPNPSTLAFIAKRLYEDKRDAEANVYRDLQCSGAITPRQVTHLIFGLCGNDPSAHLQAVPKPKRGGIRRETAAIVITDHSAFIEKVFS
ncbi:MAG: SAVED domain-containing protein [Vicinamibacterales bacterium]|nr:SAVED domain-containing protein [Vicinamibacterales bacterium]